MRRSLAAALIVAVAAAPLVYDGAGRLTSRTDPAGAHTFTWTARGELDTATDPLTGAAIDHDWDEASQLDAITYGTGASAPVRDLTFDDLGRLTEDRLTAGGSQVARLAYTYDPDSNLLTQTLELPGNPAAGTHAYAYDRAGRLTSWTPPGGAATTIAWDPAGNRMRFGAVAFTYDERGRLTRENPDLPVGGLGSPLPRTTHTYSPRGDRISSAEGLTTTTYAYDALGRLASFNGSVSYTYDALDRVATRGAASFAYAGDSIDPSSDGTHAYARSPGGRLLAVSDGTTSRLVALNRHGDLTYTFDLAGTLSSTRAYEPFGEVAGATGTFSPALGYQGDFTDPASGGVWMGARWYAPETSSFLSRDTYAGVLSTPVTLNRYTYANADPMEFFDPDGYCAVEAAPGQSCFNAILADSDQDYPGGPPGDGAGVYHGGYAPQIVRTANVVTDVLHIGLDIVGMVPVIGVPADLLNAGIYALEGDYANAGISLGMAAAVGPVFKAATGFKRWFTAGEAAEAAAGAARTTRAASDVLKAPPEVLTKAGRASDDAVDVIPGVRQADAAGPSSRLAPTTGRNAPVRRSSDPGSVDDGFVYRGVSPSHPGYADALDGNAFPRNPDGAATPEAHNLGRPEALADSPFTSWTRDPAIARRYAGPEGVVLRVPTGTPPPGSPWKFEWSPDVWYEREVLIRGPVRGAERWR